ncbi:VOC family protein [Mycobacterium sp. 48b]|uniref:VOC family protein n=1 Tax=Mycobacterium sp. 48b TaxID=3400426 RepID=UPI003AAFA9D2
MSGHITYRTGAARYQVTDVERAVAFYTKHLGFDVALRGGPAFASVVNGNLTLFLSGPGSSGARQLPDGTPQTPGGYNRIVIEVDDLDAAVTELRGAGVGFRNTVETGPGGRQIQLTDPDGNPVELFEPAAVKPPAE